MSITQAVTSLPDAASWSGIDRFLDEYVGVAAGDAIVILYSDDARVPTAWVTAALQSRDLSVELAPVELLEAEVGKTDLARLLESVGGKRLMVFTLEHTAVTPSIWLQEALAQVSGRSARVFRLIKVGAELFSQCFNVGPTEISRINGGLLELFKKHQKFRITSSSGTDLQVELDNAQYRWVSSRGVWREDSFVFLPAGEVSTFPALIDGTLVADGGFNTTAYTAFDARLGANPVTVEIKDGYLTEYECAHPTMRKLIANSMLHPNARRVGELGIGTNTGATEFVALNSHINERHASVHVGFGRHNQGSDRLYSCPIHLDLITSDCTIEFPDGTNVASADFAGLSAPHPPIETGIFDEDIDGDCCGVFSVFARRDA